MVSRQQAFDSLHRSIRDALRKGAQAADVEPIISRLSEELRAGKPLADAVERAQRLLLGLLTIKEKSIATYSLEGTEMKERYTVDETRDADAELDRRVHNYMHSHNIGNYEDALQRVLALPENRELLAASQAN